MKGNVKSLVLAALAVACIAVVSITAVGPAAAQSGNQSVTFPVNETLSVDDDTESLRVVADNITETGTADVTVFGIDDGGNESEVATGTLDTSGAETSTDTYEFTDVNASEYPEYRVNVDGEFGADDLEISKVQVVSGGGGLLPGDLPSVSSPVAAGAGGVALLIVIGLIVLLVRRD